MDSNNIGEAVEAEDPEFIKGGTANESHARLSKDKAFEASGLLGEDASETQAREPNVGIDTSRSRCTNCQHRCHIFCRPCLTKYNPLPTDPKVVHRLHHAFLCPPHGKLGQVISFALAMFVIWGVLWAVTGEEALPGGNFFALIMLVVLCLLGGGLVAKIRLPPLLGMLVVGCLLRNIPVIDIGEDIDPKWSSALRNIALVVILTRAGLGLDPVALRKLSFGIIRLAFIPCLVETVTVAVASNLLLGFPWDWGFILGFVLSAVSPAVVVPSMLSLKDGGFGVDKGIPTLVIAAASVDDVLAISGFGVVLGIAFSEGNIVLTILKGLLEAVAGIVYGVVFGIVCWYIPHQKHNMKTLLRFILVFGGGLLATFGSRALDISGAGALGCLTLSFVSALGWRKELASEEEEMPMASIMATMWLIFQPLLFGLIGAEIDISNIQAKTIGLGIGVLCIGLTTRSVAAFLAVLGTGLNMKERLFIPIAWLPKATVQAAIGSVALDTARDKNAPDDQIELGIQILTTAVLVILVTAPIGAALIALTAPRLLKKTVDQAVASSNDQSNQSDKAEAATTQDTSQV